MDRKEIRGFYLGEIKNKLLPYWMRYVDSEYGGVYTCISNDGEKLISKDKYIWSQGRWLYILSFLLKLKERELEMMEESIVDSAHKTASFLLSHSFDSSYRCVFKTTREGDWLRENDGDYYSSIYADCFVVMGLSLYSTVFGKRDIGRVGEKIMDSILSRIDSGEYRTAPYEIDKSYSSHGIPMILHSTLFVLEEMLESFGETREDYRDREDVEADRIYSTNIDKDKGLLMECVSSSPDYSKLLDRHINPGHTLEDAWFLLDHYKKKNRLDEVLVVIEKVVKNTFSLSWDSECGGIYRYVDMEGGRVRGISGETPYESLLTETWSMKLWWPHSEALYLFLRLYQETKNEEYHRIYSKVFEYVFSVFPSRINGEWIQIRNKRGESEERVVALPVKDPFHIMRDYLMIIELTEAGHVD